MNSKDLKLGSGVAIAVAFAVCFGVIAFGASLTMDDPTVVIGIMYACSFIALAWKYPQVALALTVASSVFQTDLTSGFGPYRLSIGEISVVLVFIAFIGRFITRGVRVKFGPYIGAILVYLVICLASSMANWSDMCVTSMLQMILYFIITPLVFANLVPRVEQLTISLYLLIGVCIFLAIFGLSAGTFFILGLHKNGVGSSLACGLIVCTELWLVQQKTKGKVLLFASVIIITAGLIFSLSRGAWLSAVVGFVVVIVYRGKFRFMMQSMVVLIPLIAVFWNLLPEESKTYATNFDPSAQNISARYDSIEFARNQFLSSPVFGVGVGLRKEFDATNVFWVTLAETGIPGLIAFAMVHIMTLLMIYRTQKFVSRKDPRFSLLVLGGALLFAKVVHGVVDHYWSRGPLLIAWACAGMATGIYFHEQARLDRLKISILANNWRRGRVALDAMLKNS